MWERGRPEAEETARNERARGSTGRLSVPGDIVVNREFVATFSPLGLMCSLGLLLFFILFFKELFVFFSERGKGVIPSV